uniref:Uncharacterized protein n=1 Tax=Strongyloides venezuelensis TaxID=75913 RepID=A0A0K0FMU3_STRVS
MHSYLGSYLCQASFSLRKTVSVTGNSPSPLIKIQIDGDIPISYETILSNTFTKTNTENKVSKKIRLTLQ